MLDVFFDILKVAADSFLFTVQLLLEVPDVILFLPDQKQHFFSVQFLFWHLLHVARTHILRHS